MYERFNNSEIVTTVLLKLVDEERDYRYFDQEFFVDFLKGLGCMFYVVDPTESSFRDPKDVPTYFTNVS